MKAMKYPIALAIAALLSACGGGGEAPTLSVEKMSAVSRQQAPQTVTPAQAADLLMDLAQTAYADYFPAGGYTAFMYQGISVRYYAALDTYLGVVTTAESGYPLYEILVVGGALGGTLAAPHQYGVVTDYMPNLTIDAGGGGGGGGGTGNGCFDLSLAETQGTAIHIAYNYSGTITGTATVDTTVGAMTTYEGHAARATTVNTTGFGGAASVTASGTNYSVRSGDAEITQYGSVINSTVSGFNVSIKTVYTPPFVDTQSGLALGASVVQHTTGQANTTFGGFNTPSTIDATTTVTYVANESVSVPAGTFQACKYTIQAQGSSDVTTTWYVKGKGIPVKITNTGSASQTIEATSATINGAAL